MQFEQDLAQDIDRSSIYELFSSILEKYKIAYDLNNQNSLYDDAQQLLVDIEIATNKLNIDLSRNLTFWLWLIMLQLNHNSVIEALVKKLTIMKNEITTDNPILIYNQTKSKQISFKPDVVDVANFFSKKPMKEEEFLELLVKEIKMFSLSSLDLNKLAFAFNNDMLLSEMRQYLLNKFTEPEIYVYYIDKANKNNSPIALKSISTSSIVLKTKGMYVWDIYFKTHSNDTKNISYFIWTFSSALESIYGVKVELEDWGKGSWWAKFKLKIANWAAKEEVKQVVDKALKAAKAAEAQYLDTPILTAENQELENEKLKKELESMHDADSLNELKQLELQEKRLEIEMKKLEIESKKQEIVSSQLDNIKKASELMKDGILKNDSDFQLSINSIVIAERKDNQLLLPENIEKVDKDSTNILDTDKSSEK